MNGLAETLAATVAKAGGQRMPDGRASCGTLIFDDIAETVRAETEEDRIRRIVREELVRVADVAPRKTGPISCRECKEAAARIFGITFEQINGNLKSKPISQARQAAIWVAFNYSGQNLSEVARNFNRDHTSIRYSVHKCQSLCATNGDFADKVGCLVNTIVSNIRERR